MDTTWSPTIPAPAARLAGRVRPAGTVIDLRPPARTAPVRTPSGHRAGLDPSARALVAAARAHADRAEGLRQRADREAEDRCAAVLALHALYECSVPTIAHLLGVTVAEARSWLREGRHAELASG